ncbi:hypothetical protein IFM89_020113 [Coptis chinensis]|uniref:RST domain-containing protein n=1 Tax=Coptis chinensis TaxID=261450 RepID=A0A835MA54_9MAGN|nr:hypothetical protein IFM89_020113 [Coptis chinensis]
MEHFTFCDLVWSAVAKKECLISCLLETSECAARVGLCDDRFLHYVPTDSVVGAHTLAETGGLDLNVGDCHQTPLSVDTSQGKNSSIKFAGKPPKSAWMPFSKLFAAIEDKVPYSSMKLVYQFYGQFRSNKISRDELVHRMRWAIGDTLLRATIISLQAKVKGLSSTIHDSSACGTTTPGKIKGSDYKGGRRSSTMEFDGDEFCMFDLKKDVQNLVGVGVEFQMASIIQGYICRLTKDEHLLHMWYELKPDRDKKYHLYVFPAPTTSKPTRAPIIPTIASDNSLPPMKSPVKAQPVKA